MNRQNSEPAARPIHAGLPTPPDSVLVERVRTGDSIAFELIMRRHNQQIYRLARSVLRNAPDAEDVVQETYVRAYAKLDDFIGPDGFSAWLGKIAFNEALGRLRQRGRVVSLDEYVRNRDGAATKRRIETMKDQQPDPERLASNSELRKLLESAIDSLPDDFRAVFMLRAVEGMSVAETAECLSTEPATIKTRFHRARDLLKKSLGAELGALMPSVHEFAGARCDRIVAGVLSRLDFASLPWRQ